MYLHELRENYPDAKVALFAARKIARKAARELGVPAPKVRLFGVHYRADWYEADWKAGRWTMARDLAPAGFFDSASPDTIWIRSGRSYAETRATIRHEIQHYSDYLRGVESSEERAVGFVEQQARADELELLRRCGIRDPKKYLEEIERREAEIELKIRSQREKAEDERPWRYNEATRRYEPVEGDSEQRINPEWYYGVHLPKYLP